MSEPEGHCPNCGAMVTADAEWCGQCFTSLRAPEPTRAGPVAAIRVVATDEARPGAGASALRWPCPACGTENPIEANLCSVCGTPFGELFRQDEAPPHVDPSEAFRRSLVFPGLGHRAIGRGGEGLARGVLFVMCVAIALVAAISGAGAGAVLLVAGAFGALALLVYLGSAYEASKMAQGSAPLVSSRAIVWAVSAVLMAAVFILAILITFATRASSTQ
jgi:double zinc ribbon protein